MRVLLALLLLGLCADLALSQRPRSRKKEAAKPKDKPAEEPEEKKEMVENEEEEEPKDTVEVATPYGYMRGLKVENEEDDMVHYQFLGVPYAEAPVGKYRFKDTVPIRPWQGILNATKFGNACPQPGIFFGDPNTFVGEEDCLFLNVFTPRLPRSRSRTFGAAASAPSTHLLPVMVFIHGGGFTLGSGEIDPTPLLQKDVVVVTINYRLGALGFFSLDSPLLSGNQGLKDQTEALRFINRNIADLGGDPDRVIVFGESAGAISSHLQVLSPTGEGLFHGAIIQSGTALSFTADTNVGNNEKSSERFVTDAGCESVDVYRVLQCLQAMNASDIYNITLTADKQSVVLNAEEEAEGRGPYKWMPTIDSISPNPFMPEHPMQVLKSGNQKDIPVIMGVTKDDGGLVPAFAYWDKLDSLNENFTSIYGPQNFLGVAAGEATELDKKKAEAVMRFYLGSGNNFTQDNIQEMIDLFGDILFNFPTYKALQLHSHSSSQPVFMYELGHKPSRTLMELFGKDTGANTEDWGVAHGDDLLFLFNNVFGLDGAVETEEDKDVMEQMTTMWTNFAKHGDPTPYQDGDLIIWEPFENSNENYLEIMPESMIKSGYHPTRMFFWQRIVWDDLEEEVDAITGAQSSLPAPAPNLSLPGGRANSHQGQPRAYVASQSALPSSTSQGQTLPFPFAQSPGNFFYQS